MANNVGQPGAFRRRRRRFLKAGFLCPAQLRKKSPQYPHQPSHQPNRLHVAAVSDIITTPSRLLLTGPPNPVAKCAVAPLDGRLPTTLHLERNARRNVCDFSSLPFEGLADRKDNAPMQLHKKRDGERHAGRTVGRPLPFLWAPLHAQPWYHSTAILSQLSCHTKPNEPGAVQSSSVTMALWY